jgi:hypothetical protein
MFLIYWKLELNINIRPGQWQELAIPAFLKPSVFCNFMEKNS